MEARFIQEKLESTLERLVFLDSDDLKDLTHLTQHVRDADALVLVQTKSVLSRPYCLLELLTAVKAGVPIIGVAVTGGAHAYDYNQAFNFLTHLDSQLEQVNPGASKLLLENGQSLVLLRPLP